MIAAEYAVLQTRYLEALQRYIEKPRGTIDVTDSLHLELSYLEEAMINEAPGHLSKGLTSTCVLKQKPKIMLAGEIGFPVIPESDLQSLVSDKNYPSPRLFVTNIHDQASYGSCASEAKDASEEIIYTITTGDPIEFNSLATYGLVNGGRDGGSSLEDNIVIAQTVGCFPENVWPRSKGWHQRPSDEAFAVAKKYRLLEHMRVTTKQELWTGMLYGCPGYIYYDSHSIVTVTPIDRLRCVYRNSWGLSWGDNGFGTISYSSIGFDSCYLFLSPTWGDRKLVLPPSMLKAAFPTLRARFL